MKIIAKEDFQAFINGNLCGFIKGEEIKNLTYEQITKLNEKGFIEPLEYKDLVIIKRELNKEKEDKDGINT